MVDAVQTLLDEFVARGIVGAALTVLSDGASMTLTAGSPTAAPAPR